uniref:Peptidase S1 domain-containing protein n=1 Tax=Steinernema glaseri TaxID=37863 RepID=A0A1I8A745_9BILA
MISRGSSGASVMHLNDSKDSLQVIRQKLKQFCSISPVLITAYKGFCFGTGWSLATPDKRSIMNQLWIYINWMKSISPSVHQKMVLLFPFLLWAALVHSAPLEGNDIIGGSKADNGAWPWQAFLSLYDHKTGRSTMCGGSLISKRHVVTAAHCTFGIRAQDVEVMLGSVKRFDSEFKNPTVIYPRVKRVWVHPEYTGQDPSFRNDISIIEFEKDITLNGNVKPIRVRRNDTALRENSPSSGGSPDLMQTRVPFIGDAYCKYRWLRLSNNRIVVDDTQVCAGSYRRGTAPGDSGGPLVVKGDDEEWYLVALTSFGENTEEGLDDQFTYPGVYLRLSQYCSSVSKETGYLAICV